MKRIYIGGVQGVGKDTLLTKVSWSFPNFEVVHFAEYMKERTGESSHDALLRSIDPEKRGAVRNAVFDNLKNHHGNLFVNGHYSLPIRDCHSFKVHRFEQGIPDEYGTLFSHYVLIESSAENVHFRRQKDATRQRDISLENIRLEIQSERFFFDGVTSPESAKMIIHNDWLDEAVERFTDYLRREFRCTSFLVMSL